MESTFFHLIYKHNFSFDFNSTPTKFYYNFENIKNKNFHNKNNKISIIIGIIAQPLLTFYEKLVFFHN